jgi:hypothetical protein
LLEKLLICPTVLLSWEPLFTLLAEMRDEELETEAAAPCLVLEKGLYTG